MTNGVIAAGLSAIALAASPAALAQNDSLDPGVFAKWLNPGSPACVPVSEFKSVSQLIKLSPHQFQFARAFYIAIPPVSRELPPGDSAVMARSGGKTMIALVEGDLSCARFLAPDFVQAMLAQVGRGENGGTVGTAI